MSKGKPIVRLRKATSHDAARLLTWRNQSDVRRNSFQKGSISLKEHRQWLTRKLEDPRSKILIIEKNGGQPIGQLRIDRHSGGVAEVSIALGASQRRSGVGTAALRLAVTQGRKISGVRRLIGRIRAENVASMIAFLKAGFILEKPASVKGIRCYQLKKDL